MTARTVIFMASGFEEMELTITVDILRRAGVETLIAGIDEQVALVKGSRGIMMMPDIAIDQVDCGKIDMVILPGGVEGTNNLAQSEKVIAILQKMHKAGKKVAAICAAPAILVKAGLAKGRRLTSHPAAADLMQGVDYSEDRVVVDGNITTSRAAGTTFEFAFALVEQLVGKAAIKAVNDGVLAKIS